MCGGTAQTTQQVQIPPEVMQNYQTVNARAAQVAATPFQQYSTDPNAFVAPINQTQQSGINAISAAGDVSQPYFQGATQQLMGGQAAATPYYGEATQQLLGGLNAGVTGTQAAYQPLQQGAQDAQGLQGGALAQYQGALQSAQPYNQAAGQYAQAGLSAATPYYGQAAQNIAGAQDVGGALGGASLNSLQQAGQAAQPLQSDAAGYINSAASAAQPYNQAATAGIMGGLAGSQPFNAAAARGINQAQAGAQPYQGMATGLAAAGTQAVNAGPLGGEQINQYMSPYLNSVVSSTMANLQQQQGQEQSSLLGDQISQGAFGGDRGGIAQANLARQQDLATGQTVSGLMNQGYGQALSAAQQQQQLGLGAAQANRAALQQGASQMLGIGQQGYSQGMGAAQAQQGLGQQIYGQGLGAGQAMAGIGQQQYGQQMGTGQAQAALGSQLFSQGAQTAQQQAAMGQQLYGQGIGAASAQQGLGQGLYSMGTGMGGFMQGLGQQNYAQQSGTGQNLAQLGQQTFGQGAAQSGQQAALAQQQYGMGAGAAGQMAGLGQGIYGMGAGTSQALAGMGTQAQQNALAAGQAQLGAGTVAQQTQQAGQTALYNQFLQQQGFPYQQAQFLANIAMGTGALSGSTTQTTQPMPFFSDERLKEGVEPIGKTFDGQKIVKFRYKNEPGTRIGLIAQDVEKHHPEAVGLAGGYKTVDYDAATKDAASKGHYARGGLAPESEGGAVLPSLMRRGFAQGGNPAQLIGNDQLAAILQAQFGMYGNQGIPGLGGAPGASGFVPAGTLPVGNLTVAGAPPALPESQLKGMLEASGGVQKAYDTGNQVVEKVKRQFRTDEENKALDKAAQDKAADVAYAAEQRAAQSKAEAAQRAASAANASNANANDASNANANANANGGLVGHYASGGASSGPYGVPISKVETPDLITAGDAPEFQKSGFLKMLDTAGDVASLGKQGVDTYNNKAAGGAAEDDVGAGTPYDAGSNPFMPDSAKGIEKKELAKPGAAPGAPESGFSQAMSAAKDVGSIAALAMLMNRGGRTGYADGGLPDDSGTPEDLVNKARGLLSSANDPKADLSQAEKAAMLATAESNRRQAAERINQQYTTPEDYQNFAGAPDQIGYGAPDPTVWRKPSQIAARQTADANRESNRIAGLSAVGLSPQGNILPQARKPGTAVVDIPAGTFADSRGTPRVLDKNANDNRGPVLPAVPRKTAGLIPTPTPRPDLNGDASPAITSANMAPGLGGRNPPPPISSDLAGSPAYQQTGLAPVQALTDTHAAEGALLARTGFGAPNIRQDLQKDADKTPSFLERAESTIAPKGGYLDRLTSGNEADLIPFLTGLGAMAGSSNRYGLGALAEGIGAGAAAYQPTKQAMLERAKTSTAIAGQRLAQSRQASDASSEDIQLNPATGAYRVFMPDGSYVDYKAWNDSGRPATYHQVNRVPLIGPPGGPSPVGSPPGSPPPSSPPLGGSSSDADNTTQGSGIPGMGKTNPVSTANTGIVPIGKSGQQTLQTNIDLNNSGGITPAMRAQSDRYQEVVDATARSASDSLQDTRNLALHIARQDLTGPLGAGPLSDFVSGIVGKLNDGARRIGVPDLQFGQNAIANKETFDKLVKTSAFQQASAADQNSLNALGLSLSAIANPNMPRESQADIVSKNMVSGQEPMDRQGYLRSMRAEAANAGMPNAYISQAADTAFRNDKPKSSYLYEQSLLKGLMITSPNTFAKMLSGEITAKSIDDQFMKTYGVPHMSRYFTGGMQ